jgi:hypothetical protein
MVLVAGTTTATLARVARLSGLGVRVWMDMGLLLLRCGPPLR